MEITAVTYIEKTPSYNERRYGKPWMAITGSSLTKDFTFLDWEGRPGCAGEFCFTAEPGTILAYGQKDIRKGRGGVDGYQICLPDGSLPVITSMALDIRRMSMEDRWRHVANHLLQIAINRPTEEYKVAEWEQTRGKRAARYAAMLEVQNPIAEV